LLFYSGLGSFSAHIFTGKNMPKIEIMPSILAADMGNLESAIRQCEGAGADQIHVM
jgi:hypothetical protein